MLNRIAIILALIAAIVLLDNSSCSRASSPNHTAEFHPQCSNCCFHHRCHYRWARNRRAG